MTPVFDRHCSLVAWFDGQHIFDLNLNWIAFANGGNLFAASNSNWLGLLKDGSLIDRRGRPVAWVRGSSPGGTLKPLKPMKPLKPPKPLRPLLPLKPLKPLKPLTPLGGWSNLTWDDWHST